ncbi:ABC transporter permease [Candidatus Micrarchaeota archaeon]|nr:ABC transporter permease [Candidatus Micrarchaeota archaeon]
MKLEDAVVYALKNLSQRSLRSWLTIIGMVIGVIAIVVILSISEGFNKDITDQLASFGADQMFIYPLSDFLSAFSGTGALQQTSGKLFQADVDDINNIPGVKNTARIIYGRASLSFKGKNITSFIFGTDREMFEMYGDYIEVESGRMFKEGERNVAFFAADAATDYFGKDKINVGSVIQINGKNFRVVGIQKKIGTSLSTSDDSAIYVPFEDARDLFKGQFLADEVGMIMVQIDEGFEPDKIKQTIEYRLASNHRVKSDDLDFSVITSDQINEIVGTVLLTVQLVLAAITLIASFVGAIGIANTMFMNVLERIREIGILKSVGATKKDILMIFLVESAIIGLAGGVIGLVLGYGLLQLLIELFNIPVFLRLRIIAFVFVFSIGTGAAAGFLPAWRAAKMDPVEALRF